MNLTLDECLELYEIFQEFMQPEKNTINYKDLSSSLTSLDFQKENPKISNIFFKLEKEYKDEDINFESFLTNVSQNLVKFIIF